MSADIPDRPWYFEPTNPFIPEHGGEIRNERGKSVAFVDNAETAAKIIRAVNSHAGLMSACKAAFSAGNIPGIPLPIDAMLLLQNAIDAGDKP